MTERHRYSLRTALAGAVTMSLVLGLGVASAAAVAPEDPTVLPQVVSGEPGAAAVPVGAGSTTVHPDAGGLVTTVSDPAGVEATVDVGILESGDSVLLSTIDVDAVVDGTTIREQMVIEDFVLLGEDDFAVTLRMASTGETFVVNTTVATQQAVPVLIILGVLARLGIKHVLKWYGKTQVKKAVKSYLLNNVSANKWSHIMAPKHNWGTVGAKSREQVAELMARAMSEGTHQAYKGTARVAVWKHNGKIIEVTYDKVSGKVSNGWVK